MAIPPSYTLTPSMLATFAQIEANKQLFNTLNIPPQLLANIKRQSLLKSSLFSAQIEGNTLTLAQAEGLSESDSDVREKREVSNILRAFAYLQNSPIQTIDRDFILKLHTFTMKGLAEPGQIGKLRTKPSAIFNQEGFAVYVAPPPSEVPLLLEQLIQFINSDKERNAPIKAILAHFSFEKIHPFLDGNGRVGRLLLQTILATSSYHFDWSLSFEEILNNRKEEYYAYLDTNKPTEFIEFMLEILLRASQQILSIVNKKQNITTEDLLLPRRKELLLLIREQEMMSLDAIKRRFFKIPERTLRYDLQQLQKLGLIIKVGTTRGAVYKSK